MGQKEALLQGKNHLESVDLSGVGGNESVMVRPITEVEAGIVQSIQQKGLSAPIDLATNTATATLNDLGEYMQQLSAARVQGVAFGLSHSEETWTVEEAGQLPANQTRVLYNAICRISGIRIPTPVEDTAEATSKSGDEPVDGVDGPGPGAGDDDAGVLSGGDAPDGQTN